MMASIGPQPLEPCEPCCEGRARLLLRVKETGHNLLSRLADSALPPPPAQFCAGGGGDLLDRCLLREALPQGALEEVCSRGSPHAQQ